MEENTKKVAIVTGASSGIGYAVAKRLSKQGIVVYGCALSDFTTSDFNYYPVDVTDNEKVRDFIDIVKQKEGRLNYVVNCAGMGISGAVENTSNSAIQKIFNVNVFGTVNVCKNVLPLMRESGGGNIVNIASVAADLTIPFQTFYSATKASIEAFSSALRNEVRPFNIKVCCVLPGDAKTGFTSAREKNLGEENTVYAVRSKKSVSSMEKDEQNGMSADYVASIIVKQLLRKNPPVIKTVGVKYKVFMFLNKILPSRFVNYILFKMYG